MLERESVCMCMHAKSLQSCLPLYRPMDFIPPGSSVHWILQGRTLEWVAVPSSRGSSQPSGQTHTCVYMCVSVCVYTNIYFNKIWVILYNVLYFIYKWFINKLIISIKCVIFISSTVYWVYTEGISTYRNTQSYLTALMAVFLLYIYR